MDTHTRTLGEVKTSLPKLPVDRMGLIHTPRTIASICRGLWNRRRAPPSASKLIVGVGENHHIYRARLGLFDVDYLGHMNNGKYLQ
jgi:hypothetical protein